MLITPAQVREHHQALTGSAEDALLITLIGRVDALMAGYCAYPVPTSGNRTMRETTYTVYPRGPLKDDPRGLFLGMYPANQISSAYASADRSYGSSDLLSSSEYTLDTVGGVLWLTDDATHSWIDGDRRANKITFTGGHAITPPDLEALAAFAVAHMVRRRSGSALSAASAGGQSVTFRESASLLPPEVCNGLGPYRIWEHLLA